jgi:hypothetical protein
MGIPRLTPSSSTSPLASRCSLSLRYVATEQVLLVRLQRTRAGLLGEACS